PPPLDSWEESSQARAGQAARSISSKPVSPPISRGRSSTATPNVLESVPRFTCATRPAERLLAAWCHHVDPLLRLLGLGAGLGWVCFRRGITGRSSLGRASLITRFGFGCASLITRFGFGCTRLIARLGLRRRGLIASVGLFALRIRARL